MGGGSPSELTSVGATALCRYPGERGDAQMCWPGAPWAAGGLSRTTSAVFFKHQWAALGLARSPCCPYLNISKPNSCWGCRNLKPSNESFFPEGRPLTERLKEKGKLHFTKVKPLKALPGAQRTRTPLSQGRAGVKSSGQSEVNRLLPFTPAGQLHFLPGAGGLLTRARV